MISRCARLFSGRAFSSDPVCLLSAFAPILDTTQDYHSQRNSKAQALNNHAEELNQSGMNALREFFRLFLEVPI